MVERRVWGKEGKPVVNGNSMHVDVWLCKCWVGEALGTSSGFRVLCGGAAVALQALCFLACHMMLWELATLLCCTPH